MTGNPFNPDTEALISRVQRIKGTKYYTMTTGQTANELIKLAAKVILDGHRQYP